MNRRVILGLVIAAIGGGFIIATSGGLLGGAPAGTSAGSSGLAGASASAAPAVASAAPATSTGPAATCATTTRLIAERAKGSDTFPIPVEWIAIGPVFFTQSDVAPRIPINTTGWASITIALGYLDDTGDHYKLTAGSLTLVYDPATGRVTGPLDTGYGKNSNRATTDTVPSAFEGLYTRPPAPDGIGLLKGAVTHPGRETYQFKVQMSEVEVPNGVDPACASPRPTDVPLAP